MRITRKAVRTTRMDVRLSLTGRAEDLIPGTGLGGALDLFQIPDQGSNIIGRAASALSREVVARGRAASVVSREANA